MEILEAWFPLIIYIGGIITGMALMINHVEKVREFYKNIIKDKDETILWINEKYKEIRKEKE